MHTDGERLEGSYRNARLYRGGHWPTDVLASLLFASVRLGACVRWLRPQAS
jgi:membrane-associated phospholipid phosphatase